MIENSKVTIMRKWNSPVIRISVTSDGIALDMTLADFVCALTDEVAEPLVKEVASMIGNPTMIFSNETLQKKLVDAIESKAAQNIFIAAAIDIVEEVKKETVKLL